MPKIDDEVQTSNLTETSEESNPKKKAKAKPKASTNGKAKKAKKVGTRRPREEGQRSVNSTEPQREPKWNDRRKAIVMALRKLGATSVTSAVTAEKISETASKMKEFPGAKVLGSKEVNKHHGPKGLWYTKWHLSYYLPAELTHNGFVASTRNEGSRELVYYLTKKGQTTKFPVPEKKSKKDDDE